MKKIITSFILFFSILCFLGCNPAVYNYIYSDDSKIASSGDSFYAVKSSSNSANGEFSMISTMTGSDTIWKYNTSSDLDIDITYSLSVLNAGKVKLVLISPNGNVSIIDEVTDIATNTETKVKTLALKKGSNRIKVVAYGSAEFELKAKLNVGDFGRSF